MSKLLRTLLAATAFLTLLTTAAPAAPLLCRDICDASSCCDDICGYRVGTGYDFTTCGEWGVCGGFCAAKASTQQASMTPDDDRQADASSQVCGGEAQAEAQSSSVES